MILRSYFCMSLTDSIYLFLLVHRIKTYVPEGYEYIMATLCAFLDVTKSLVRWVLSFEEITEISTGVTT